MNIRIQLTHKNHWRFGWGRNLYNWSDDTTDLKYHSRFGRCEDNPLSYHNECIRSAQVIAQSATKPIMVLFSGGVDSEVIVRCFLEIGVPVTLGIMRFAHGLNDHDIKYALQFSREHNVPHKIFDFDPEAFMRNDAEREAAKYREFAPSLLIHMQLLKHFTPDYHTIIGGGDLTVSRHNVVKDWFYIVEKTSSTRTSIWLEENSTEGSARFFIHRPEQVLSFMTDPAMQLYMKQNPSLPGMTGSDIKYWILHTHFPGMTPRPKFTGYEKLPEFFAHTYLTEPYTNTVNSEMEEIYVSLYKKYWTDFKTMPILVHELVDQIKPQ